MKSLSKYLLALPFAAALFIYFPTLNFPFQFDDFITIINNGGLKDFEDGKDLNKLLNPNYRTVSFFSWSLSFWFGEQNPIYYRLPSLFLHLINGLFLLILIQKIEKKENQKNKPVDLVKQFYDQDIDHKALEKALTQRKNTAKGFTNFSLDPYTGEFGDVQKKHLLNRTLMK